MKWYVMAVKPVDYVPSEEWEPFAVEGNWMYLKRYGRGD